MKKEKEEQFHDPLIYKMTMMLKEEFETIYSETEIIVNDLKNKQSQLYEDIILNTITLKAEEKSNYEIVNTIVEEKVLTTQIKRLETLIVNLHNNNKINVSNAYTYNEIIMMSYERFINHYEYICVLVYNEILSIINMKPGEA